MIAIIGTAGRLADEGKVDDKLFESMCTISTHIIQDVFKLGDLKDVTLVSGGAPIADHVAVRLYLSQQTKGLNLHLPAKLTVDGAYDGSVSEGKRLNYLHDQWKKGSVQEIAKARDKGAVCKVYDGGFMERNRAVAGEATHMIALTWGKTDTPKEGGTKYTWDAAVKCWKVHVRLDQLTALGVDKLLSAIKSSNMLRMLSKKRKRSDAKSAEAPQETKKTSTLISLISQQGVRIITREQYKNEFEEPLKKSLQADGFAIESMPAGSVEIMLRAYYPDVVLDTKND